MIINSLSAAAPAVAGAAPAVLEVAKPIFTKGRVIVAGIATSVIGAGVVIWRKRRNAKAAPQAGQPQA